MPRKKKQQIKLNDSESVEGLLQEVYNEACGNINSAQREINKLDAAAEPQDVDDHTKVAKAKEGFLKVKDSGIKIKLETAKIQVGVMKENGNVEKAIGDYSGNAPSKDEMADIRKLILKRNQDKED